MNELRIQRTTDGTVKVGVRKYGSHSTFTIIAALTPGIDLNNDAKITGMVKSIYKDWNVHRVIIEQTTRRIINPGE